MKARNGSPLFILAVLLSLLSCRKDNALDCFKSSGPEVTQLRVPGSFKSIFVNDKIEVEVQQGAEYKVEVTAGRNLLRSISTKVVNEELVIDNNNTCNFVRGYKKMIRVKITAPRLDKIMNNSVSSIHIAENFSQDTLVVRIESSGDVHVNGRFNQVRTSTHGNGDTYLNGSANSLFIYSFGTNYVHARDFIVKDYTFVQSLTIGDITVNGNDLGKLEVNIGSSGDVIYTGKPAGITDYSEGNGSGRLLAE